LTGPLAPANRIPVIAEALALAKGEKVLNIFREPVTFGGKELLGSGTGTDMLIQFDIHTGRASISSGETPGDPADEELLHEMVHALRGQRGRQHFTPFNNSKANNQNYEDTEEFDAIVITNIYRSEKKRTGLRADHKSHAELKNPWDDDKYFANKYADQLDKLSNEVFLLSLRLGAIECAYNPIRQRLLRRYGANQLREWAAVQDFMYDGYEVPIAEPALPTASSG
jgi:hypothetical protein